MRPPQRMVRRLATVEAAAAGAAMTATRLSTKCAGCGSKFIAGSTPTSRRSGIAYGASPRHSRRSSRATGAFVRGRLRLGYCRVRRAELTLFLYRSRSITHLPHGAVLCCSANAAMVAEALDRCGVPSDAAAMETALPEHFGARFRSYNNNDGAAKLRASTPVPSRLIHRIVAHFLRVRFPILLALNKADRPGAAAHCSAIAAAHPAEVCVRVAARTEWRLVQWRARGRIAYTAGDARFFVVAAAGASGVARESAAERDARAVLERLGCTGVLAAIDSAVALRPPQLVFPVASLDDFRGCGRAVAEGGAAGVVLGGGCLVDAEWVKPGTTVGDLYDAMRRPAGARAPPLVSGEYVRAEGLGSARVRRVLRKSDVLDAASALVIHVQTNKRRAWQKQAAQP